MEKLPLSAGDGTEKQKEENQTETLGVKHPIASMSGYLILGTVFAVLALFLFLKLTDEVMEMETLRFDTEVVDFFQRHSTPALHSLMVGVSWLASGNSQTVVIFVTAATFFWKRRIWPEGISILVAGVGGMWVDYGLKLVFHRHRPNVLFNPTDYSFPSGHAFSAVVVYGMLAYWLAKDGLPRSRVWIWGTAIFLILIVGFSRVYLGQHYLTDVLGGYTAGLCWLWGCLALPILWSKRNTERVKRQES